MGLDVNFELRDQTANCLADNTQKPTTPLCRLRAVKISIYDYPEAERIASTWETVAREKERQATTQAEKTQFRACANISSSIATSLLYPNYNRSIFACKDSEGTHQGMMVVSVEKDRVYVALLVTNPINIRSNVNAGETKKVNGAGTCLLNKAVEIAVQERKEAVWLTPLNSAVSFYKRNGFVFDGWSMKKTVEKTEDVALPYLTVA